MKKIFITGASKGLGLAISRSCLERGDLVYGCARSGNSDMESLHAEFGDQFQFFECDLGSDGFIETIHKSIPVLDGLDGVIFNAAILECIHSISNTFFSFRSFRNCFKSVIKVSKFLSGMALQI